MKKAKTAQDEANPRDVGVPIARHKDMLEAIRVNIERIAREFKFEIEPYVPVTKTWRRRLRHDVPPQRIWHCLHEAHALTNLIDGSGRRLDQFLARSERARNAAVRRRDRREAHAVGSATQDAQRPAKRTEPQQPVIAVKITAPDGWDVVEVVAAAHNVVTGPFWGMDGIISLECAQERAEQVLSMAAAVHDCFRLGKHELLARLLSAAGAVVPEKLQRTIEQLQRSVNGDTALRALYARATQPPVGVRNCSIE